jgi:uncharacterized protein (DUF58 family)
MNTGASSPTQVSKFHRSLHRSYRRGADFSFFLASRIRRPAWVVSAVLVVSAMLGPDMDRSTLYQVFMLSMVLLLLAMLWAWFRRARLSARRLLPQYATVGEECSFSLTVTNEGRLTARGFWLLERPPDPRPGLELFATTPEPGEEQRNFFDRRFVFYRWRWLLEGRLMFTGGRSDELLTVRRGESVHTRLGFLPRRRGVIRFRDLRVLLPDPLGFFQRCRRVKAPVDQLVVLPRRYRLPPLDMLGEAHFQLGGEVAAKTVGTSGEVLGLRDYRSGDALRHIHWKGWAKTGRPIVKEFEDACFPRYGLVLDNCVDDGDAEVFEEAVSVAASFAAAIDTKRSLLDLMFIKDEAIVMTAGQGLAKAEKMLEVLAGVEAEREENFESLRRLVASYQDDFSACLGVFPGWTPERASFVKSLATSGLEVVCMIVCRHEHKTAALLKRHPVPCRALLLELGRVQEQLMTL